MNTRDTIVLGASIGGVDVFREIAATLPRELPAAVLIVQHIGANQSILPRMLEAAGPLPAHHANDGESLEPGTIYVAPPDKHLVIAGDCLKTIKGPKENFARPAIDPLFRSAAVARGPRVIGGVLTGRLDDGTAGLAAVRACGGIAITQDPEDAEAPDMPRNAMRHTAPDYILPAKQIGATLAALAGSRVSEPVSPPPELVAENKALLEPHYIDLERMSEMAKPSSLTCPECGGTLWWTQGAMPPHYRCHTGHAFSPESLNAATDSVIERSVWEAVRALHEKKVQSKLRAAYHMRLGETDDAERCLTEARNAADSARWLQRLLRGED